MNALPDEIAQYSFVMLAPTGSTIGQSSPARPSKSQSWDSIYTPYYRLVVAAYLRLTYCEEASLECSSSRDGLVQNTRSSVHGSPFLNSAMLGSSRKKPVVRLSARSNSLIARRYNISKGLKPEEVSQRMGLKVSNQGRLPM